MVPYWEFSATTIVSEKSTNFERKQRKKNDLKRPPASDVRIFFYDLTQKFQNQKGNNNNVKKCPRNNLFIGSDYKKHLRIDVSSLVYIYISIFPLFLASSIFFCYLGEAAKLAWSELNSAITLGWQKSI